VHLASPVDAGRSFVVPPLRTRPTFPSFAGSRVGPPHVTKFPDVAQFVLDELFDDVYHPIQRDSEVTWFSVFPEDSERFMI